MYKEHNSKLNTLYMPHILKILKYSVNAKECHGHSSFLEELVIDQLNMPIGIGQVHVISSTPSLRQLWVGVTQTWCLANIQTFLLIYRCLANL